jgi:hypothetical protein
MKLAVAVTLAVSLAACKGGTSKPVTRVLDKLDVSIELPPSYTFDAKEGIYAIFTGDHTEIAMVTTWEAAVPSVADAKDSCSGTDVQVVDLAGGGRMITCIEGTQALARSWVPRGSTGAIMCLAHREGRGALPELAAMCGSLKTK